MCIYVILFFFFKQKTAYEMRISDWSSDACSSDLSQAVRLEAERRGLKVFDATCPLVTKVHFEVARHCRAGRDVVLIGHAGHPEVEGTMGQWNRERGSGRIYLVEDVEDVAALEVEQPGNLAYTTQTTLSVDDTRSVIEALRDRFPAIQGPKNDDICYATQNRQDAVRELAAQCDLVLVVGSPNSSHSNRLRELAERAGVEAYLVDGADELDPPWLERRRHTGLTARAPAPDILVHGGIPRPPALGAGPRGSATWYWWSARPTAPTPTAGASWPSAKAWRPTWSTAPTRSIRSGSKADATSASPPAPRPRTSWCRA